MCSGNRKNGNSRWLPLVLVLTALLTASTLRADSFEIQDSRLVTLREGVVDLAVSSDGRWTFVLTPEGTVAVYGVAGDLVQTMEVGRGFDSIEYSPAGNRLILGASEKGQMRIVGLTLRFDLDYAGSPFRGPPEAPVTIAVFNDFQ